MGAGKRALTPSGTKKALPQVYLKGGAKIVPEIYMTDQGTDGRTMFRWIVSTMFAGVVGIGVIGTVIFASGRSDEEKGAGGRGIVSELKLIGTKALTPFKPLLVDRQNGPHFNGNKTDRLIVTARGLSTRDIIHDTFARKRDNRDYLDIKPYARLMSTLATERPQDMSKIPAFDPYKIYASTKPVGVDGSGVVTATSNNSVSKFVELPVDVGPQFDKYTMPEPIVQQLVRTAADDYFAEDVSADDMNEEIPVANEAAADAVEAAKQHNTTVIAKSLVPVQLEQEEIEQQEKTIRSGDTLNALLIDAGAENWQVQQITAAMKDIYPASNIKVGQKLRYARLPKPGDPTHLEPIELSLYQGRNHLVTVSRNEGGDFVARTEPPSDSKIHPHRGSYSHRASLYQSFYQSGLMQGLSDAMIYKLLRIHAYDTDFKQLTQPGDGFEAFYDTAPSDDPLEETPNELLYTAINVNGEKREYYRFRQPDGSIDYYDRNGNSSKKFLMRKPARGDRIRLSSGFGWRMHPILQVRKMHTGTDWAGPIGTPVLAAGNGTVEFVGTKGGYGNYIRIRHANGYKTAYAHLNGFAKGLVVGLSVTQGQVIGYLGNSGRSTASHLHFEVLVNNRFVNALTIPVPRGSRLKGHQLAQFIKERDRIDDLMSRDPVTTRVASAANTAR